MEKREPFQQTVLKYWKTMNNLLMSIPLSDTGWLPPRSGSQTPKLRQSCVSESSLEDAIWELQCPLACGPMAQALLLWAYCILLFCVSRDSSASSLGWVQGPLGRTRNCSSQDPWFSYLPHKVLLIDLGDQNVDIATTGKYIKHNKWQNKPNLYIVSQTKSTPSRLYT